MAFKKKNKEQKNTFLPRDNFWSFVCPDELKDKNFRLSQNPTLYFRDIGGNELQMPVVVINDPYEVINEVNGPHHSTSMVTLKTWTLSLPLFNAWLKSHKFNLFVDYDLIDVSTGAVVGVSTFLYRDAQIYSIAPFDSCDMIYTYYIKTFSPCKITFAGYNKN